MSAYSSARIDHPPEPVCRCYHGDYAHHEWQRKEIAALREDLSAEKHLREVSESALRELYEDRQKIVADSVAPADLTRIATAAGIRASDTTGDDRCSGTGKRAEPTHD